MRRIFNKTIAFYLFAFFVCIMQPIQGHATVFRDQMNEPLRDGWYLWDPYQYLDTSKGDPILTGLDVKLAKLLVGKVGKTVDISPVDWGQHLLDLKEGRRDMTAGATYSKERAAFAYYSIPYRFEENSLFFLRDRPEPIAFNSAQELLEILKTKKYILGVVSGTVYVDPAINDWIRDPQNKNNIVVAPNDVECLKRLLDGKIDFYLADRLVGATSLWRTKNGSKVTERNLGIKAPQHFLFSKKTISPAFVEKFNKVIASALVSDEYEKLVSWYVHPIILLQTIDTPLFRFIEYLGTIAFAISGLVIAYRDKSTLFGAFIFALLPSMGGGIMRDVIFERSPIGALQTPIYLLIVVGTVIAGYILLQLFGLYDRATGRAHSVSLDNNKIGWTLMICDALGLATFTVTGIVVSLLAQVEPLWLWGGFFAFLTGAGGGMLRDLLSKNRVIAALDPKNAPYAEVAVLWGVLFSLFLKDQASSVDADLIAIAVYVTVFGALTTRILFYYFNVPNTHFSYREQILSDKNGDFHEKFNVEVEKKS